MALTLLGTAVASAQERPVVETISGPVMGVASDGIHVFKGIPYAAPPVGDLRWMAPQPTASWTEPLDASEFGADCLQLRPADKSLRGSEDCLFLNVWAPSESDGNLPVFVYVHGGGFLIGAASDPAIDGSAFARKDVIYVSMNYRLGRFGFFGHPALTAASEGPLGNYGLLDQAAALKWVQDNIAKFGGDPSKVTLGGLSAGGISVSNLMASPATEGLFHRALILSGGGRYTMAGRPLQSSLPNSSIEQAQPFPIGPASAETAGVTFASQNGITGLDEAALAALRALPAEKVLGDLAITDIAINGYHKTIDDHAGGPIVDGSFVASTVEDAVLNNTIQPVPVMIGTTDGDITTPMPQNKDLIFAMFGANAATAKQVYDPNGDATDAKIAFDFGRDWLITEPARFLASFFGQRGIPAYRYEFAYQADTAKGNWPNGVPHGQEEVYFFNTLPVQHEDLSEVDRVVAEQTNTYLVNFIKTGNPNGEGLPAWQSAEEAPDGALVFGNDGAIEFKGEHDKSRLDLVESVRPAGT